MLSKIVVEGWPDRQRFRAVVGGRKVRAIGEMTNLLMARGEIQATVRLEQLWNEICRGRNLALFCAFSHASCSYGSNEDMGHICREHSEILDGKAAPSLGHVLHTFANAGWHRGGAEAAIALDIQKDRDSAGAILAVADVANDTRF